MHTCMILDIVTKLWQDITRMRGLRTPCKVNDWREMLVDLPDFDGGQRHHTYIVPRPLSKGNTTSL